MGEARTAENVALGVEPSQGSLFAEEERGLSGHAVMLGRVAWLLLVLPALGLFVWSLPLSYADLTREAERFGDMLARAGIEPLFYVVYKFALEMLFALAFVTVGLVIYRRKRTDAMGMFVSLTLVLFGTIGTQTAFAVLNVAPGLTLLLETLSFLAYAGMMLFFYVFPNGRFLPRWTRYLALFWLFWLAITYLMPTWKIDWLPEGVVRLIPSGLLVGLYGSAAFAQVLRYFYTPSRVQRQQTKWVAFGSALAFVGAVVVSLPRFLDPSLNLSTRATVETLYYSLFRDAAVNLFLMLIPVSIGVAILRYRLWNIDLIINRTLVYVPLSAIVAGTYTASVGLFQRIFVAVTGERSDAAVVLSTLVIASTFTPIKNGVQALVDRRFKEAPDAKMKLRGLVKQLEGSVWQVNREVITRRLLDDAVAGFGAEGGAIYLRQDGKNELVCTVGEWDESEALVRVPLEHNGKMLGVLKLGRRRERESYSKGDYKVLEEAASAVARALAQ